MIQDDDDKNTESQADDAAAAREAAAAAAARGEPTEADKEVDRANALDEARAKAADRTKAEEKAKGKDAEADKGKAKEAAVEEGEAEAAIFVEPTAEDREWAVETYGSQIATAMDKAGINPPAANAYYQEHGKLPESAFAKLQEAGYPRAMVDTYLKGVATTKGEAEAAANEMGVEVTKIAGSKGAWDRMVKWASEGGLSAAEVNDFNAVIDTKNVGAMRVAASALKARFEQANGKLPKVQVSGGNAGKDTEANAQADAGGDVFKDVGEVVAAQRDPRYQSDAVYRKSVEAKVVRSNKFGKAKRPG
jgi:hypothetical protein